MKKLRSLSVLVIPIIVLVLFTCCQPIDNSGSGSFTYDGTTYPLTNGALENWGRGDFDVLLASSGLNAVLWEGIGNVVWFDLVAPSTIGAPGTYDWAGTDGFTLWDGGISFNFNKSIGLHSWQYFAWHSGQKHNDIGIHFGIGESGVSQGSRRVAMQVDKNKKLKKD